MEGVLPGLGEPLVPEAQRAALRRLARSLPAGAYLAGGVAVAWRFEHRGSVDLDVFVPGEFDAAMLARDLSSAGPGLEVTSVADRTVYAVVDGIPASVIGYRPLPLRPVEVVPGLALGLASLEDLVTMKLAAIGGRGAAKDFWDLDVMLRGGVCGGELGGALAAYATRFPGVDPGYVLRALTYFGDADPAPLPAGLTGEEWASIKQRSSARVRGLFESG